MKKITNISIREYKKFLEKEGCKHIRTTGGHDHYCRSDLGRPITFSNHIDPIPQRVITNALKNLGMTKKEFLKKFN